MSTSPNLSWQPSLFETVAETRIDEGFEGLERIHLDPASWVDFAPSWVAGSDALFAECALATEAREQSPDRVVHLFGTPQVLYLFVANSPGEGGVHCRPPQRFLHERKRRTRHGGELAPHL